MADLTHGGFVLASSQSGSLSITWVMDGVETPAELHVWILLSDPRELDPGALHPDRLLAELIRVPVDPTAGNALCHVPVGRPMGVLLMARDVDGGLIAPPPFTVMSGPALTRPAPTQAQAPAPTPAPAPSQAPTPAQALTPTPAQAPASLSTTTSRQRIPLVFARPGSGVAAAFGSDPASSAPPAFSALKDRVQALTALAPRSPASSPTTAANEPLAGFGIRQRWTLTRLAFPQSTGRERRLVLQPTFIGRSDLSTWRFDPPSWAIPVPDRCDGLVDGLSAEDQTIFYAVLEDTDDGWTALSLTPSAPPFSDIATPLLLGDPAARLAAHARPAGSSAFDELFAQAQASLVNGLPHLPDGPQPPHTPNLAIAHTPAEPA